MEDKGFCFAVLNCTRAVKSAICIVVALWQCKAIEWMCVKTYSSVDVHASELSAWATVVKKDSAPYPTKDAPQPASNEEASNNKDMELTPTPTFAELGGCAHHGDNRLKPMAVQGDRVDVRQNLLQR